MLINSYASCRRLLDHMKQIVGIQHEGTAACNAIGARTLLSLSLVPQIETIDVMDNDGKLKELNVHSDDYATDFLIARNTYYILKVEGNRIVVQTSCLSYRRSSGRCDR